MFCGGYCERLLDSEMSTDVVSFRKRARNLSWDLRAAVRGSGTAATRWRGAILRIPPFAYSVPFGAGSGVYDSCSYQLFTSTVAPPTPHPGLKYGCIVIDHPDDLTEELCARLRFVENSPVVNGPLGTCSAVFHGFDGEELGIDVALAFTVAEPGEPSVIYAYRTPRWYGSVVVVRDCDSTTTSSLTVCKESHSSTKSICRPRK